VALSRMEIYLAVIKVLEDGDLITQKQVLQEADLKIESPKEIFEFLVNAQLIVEKKVGNKKVYAITEKGERLYNYFRLNDDSEIFGGTNITKID
jgi:predicted transcriptional regulator